MAVLERFALWAPVALWAALIFVLSSIPDLTTGLVWDAVVRKVAHAGEYAVLGALLARALARDRVAFVLGSAYAVTDEIHQSFVEGRVGSPLDWWVDTAGVAIGIVALARLAR
ncbi:MAG: VanZ family protein [Thermoleophilia bacterium]|nr:VanZ family protein [Thermoleophilia bacterium]MDQ3857703.1 VanZ family protein [Actinomycetota bacterium]